MRFHFVKASCWFFLALPGVLLAQDFYPISEVTATTAETDLYPVINLIQGPEVGFEAAEPNNRLGGGSSHLWVTDADAGFPADYIEEVEQPVIQLDLGEDRVLKEISVWGYSGSNSNGTSQFSLRFATDAEGTADGIFGTVDYGASIEYNPTFELFVDPIPQQYNLFSEVVVARYVEFTNLDNFFIAPGDGSEPPEEPLPRLLPVLPGGDRVGLGEIAFLNLPESFQPGDLIPRSIEGDEFGTLTVGAVRSGQEFGPPSEALPGLAQEWYNVGNPGSKDGMEGVFASNDPVVPAFRGADSSWWTGSSTALADVPAYPEEVGDFITGNNYTVRSQGEILIEESGLYRFTDGVDDFTYVAIDLDRSGVAGDTEEEVLINDNSWTDVLTGANAGGAIAEIEIEDVADGGEWLAFEFNMGEGGGGDSGVLYWDFSTESGVNGNEDFFPFEESEAIFDELDAELLLIPDSHLRSAISELIYADSEGSLADAIGQADVLQLVLQIGPEGFDQIVLEDVIVGEGVSTMDVAGATVEIQVEGELTEGTEFQIIAADVVTGLEEFNLLLDDPSMWDTSMLSEGKLIFGAMTEVCVIPEGGLAGDLDGNGEVDFADFLTLSGNFGATDVSYAEGDIDCDGEVAFADFLALSGNFGAVAAVSSVPEPGGFALLGLGIVFAMLKRRPRR